MNDQFENNFDQPLITVVIPTYNRMPYIIEAVNSVIDQTYTNWELFVVDDGSDDQTVQAIRSIQDTRIHIIELQHEGHIGKVIDAGIKNSSGKWVTFLGSDDIWLPGKLAIQLDALQKTGKRWCYGGYELMDETKKLHTH